MGKHSPVFSDPEERTGFNSPSLIPSPVPSFPSLPHMSSTMANLVPVPVSQPHTLSLSSTACNRPRSWSTRFLSRARSSKISSDVFKMNENSRYAPLDSVCGGKSAMCNGLSYVSQYRRFGFEQYSRLVHASLLHLCRQSMEPMAQTCLEGLN